MIIYYVLDESKIFVFCEIYILVWEEIKSDKYKKSINYVIIYRMISLLRKNRVG